MWYTHKWYDLLKPKNYKTIKSCAKKWKKLQNYKKLCKKMKKITKLLIVGDEKNEYWF